MDSAATLLAGGCFRQARENLNTAIALLADSPDSEDLADAYILMVWSIWSDQEADCAAAFQWYEKALAVWSRNGNNTKLSGHLSNVSSMYYRTGDLQTALERALRGLDVQREHPTPAESPACEERVAAWTHAASCHLALGQVDEAEAVIKDGLACLGEDTPNCGYLWDLQAQVHDERASRCRQKAEKLRPPQHCSI